MRTLGRVFLLLSGCLFLACTADDKQDNSMDRDTVLKFEQYQVQGRKLYLQHCAQCHQPDGTGLADLIPPLAGVDFLQDTSQTVCIIRYGAKGPLVVNGKVYNQVMPANPQLTALEVAELATYISNAWGNEGGYFITAEAAKAVLEGCQ